ncbi:transcriptional regulatory protein LGE1-domain-containing protein [Scheffersomyces amazonensis]|uniref:transcriptional regulatory protein LGE1-domain-containing protein n=1 Tax=Scheffersomyces amazonensis TaxID=1078765 RepID=UPI00315C9FA6
MSDSAGSGESDGYYGYGQYAGDESYYNNNNYRGGYRGRGRGYDYNNGYSSYRGGYRHSSYSGRNTSTYIAPGARDTHTRDTHAREGHTRDESEGIKEDSHYGEEEGYDGYRGNNYRGSYRGGRDISGRGRGGSTYHYRASTGGIREGYSHDTYSKESSNSSSGTPIHARDTSVSTAKTFNNPWIGILQIDSETTQDSLEKNYNDLKKVNKDIDQLQKIRLELENSVNFLDNQLEREALNVQLTNEKLEEFAYL